MTERWRNLSQDAALSLLLLVGTVVGLALTGLPRTREIDLGAFVLGVAAALAVAARRIAPVPIAIACSSLTVTFLLLGYPYSPILVSFFVSLYSLARHRPLRWVVPVAAGALGMLVLHAWSESRPLSLWSSLVPRTSWVLLPVATGVAVRQSVESARRARDALVRHHVDRERLRVSREVHDIVGHGLAAIKMQAEVALHVRAAELARVGPTQADQALAAISRTSATALDELRVALAGLSPEEDRSRRRPTGLDQMEELRRRVLDAGLRTTVRIDGDLDPLPAEVDLAAYRVVQEALTNVLRHSRAQAAAIRISSRADVVSVEVADDGEPRSTAVAGHGSGIDGLRARVVALGGELTTSRPPHGGFVVRATIPVAGTAPAPPPERVSEPTTAISEGKP